MDFKDPKIQKIGLAVGAFFIIAFFWYSRVYSRYDGQIAARSEEFESITTNLRNVEMKAKSLDALRLEYEELIQRYHEIEALLPEVKQIPSFLVQLHMASSITGTRITAVTPTELASDQFYNVASFEIAMTGRYHDFGRFISYVANFPFITNVSDMKVEATTVAITGEEARQKEETPGTVKKDVATMKCSFTLSTYFVKEEERLKELVL